MWIEFAAIPGSIGTMSGGEKRFLRIVASIGAEQGQPVAVSLEGDLLGLDRRHLALVLAAVAHGAGSHQHADFPDNDDGRPMGFTSPPGLLPWPGSVTERQP